MSRQSARDRVNAALDNRPAPAIVLFDESPPSPLSAFANLGLTLRDIEKRDLARRYFGDEDLTLAQKRRREEALSHGD